MIPLHDDNPTFGTPYVTWGLIFACLAVFLWMMGLSDQGFQRAVLAFGAIPSVLLGEVVLSDRYGVLPGDLQFLSALTSLFLHGGWWHLLGNMLFLYIFGNNVEEATGSVKFFVFYLICGLAAIGGHVLLDPNSNAPLIGASGAVAGVLGAYLLLYPRARILVFLVLIPVRLPAFLVLGGWFIYQFWALAGGERGLIAWWAHIAGFIAGMILIPVFKSRHVNLFNPPVPINAPGAMFRRPPMFRARFRARFRATGKAPWADPRATKRRQPPPRD